MIPFLADASTKPPLVDATTATIIVALIGALFTGVFSIWVKKARSPADRLAQQVALEQAQAQRARDERERDAAKEQGFREAAEFVKKSAETAIATYRDQTSELRETIQVLTASLETHQRIKEAERLMGAAEREANESTITRLQGRIAALEEQIKNLLDLTRAQQLKIDVMEGRRSASSEELDDSTIPRAQLEHLQAAMAHDPLEPA
jgi:chromosome segregation ATPase